MHKDAFLVLPVSINVYDKMTTDVNDKTMRARIAYTVDRSVNVRSNSAPDKEFYTRPIHSFTNNELWFRPEGNNVSTVSTTPDYVDRLFISAAGNTYMIFSEDDIYPMSVRKQGYGDAIVHAVCLRQDSFSNDKSGRSKPAYDSSPGSTRDYACEAILLDGTGVSGARLFDGTITKQDYISRHNLVPYDDIPSLPISVDNVEAIQSGSYGNYYYSWLSSICKAYHGTFLDLANRHIVKVEIHAPRLYSAARRRVTVTRSHMYYSHSPLFEDTVVEQLPNDKTSEATIRVFLRKHIADCKYIKQIDIDQPVEPQQILSRTIQLDSCNIKSHKFKPVESRKVHVQEEPTAMTLDVKVSRNICQS